MAFDGIIVSAVAREMSNLLIGGKIEKIHQPEADELVFHIRAQTGSCKLYASSGSSHARFHMLTKTPENRKVPFAFCMLLRKHLAGGRITGIAQKDSERVLEISIDTLNELGFSVNKTLIIEIMGKHSNIILIDAETQRIIDSIKRVSLDESRVRQVLPGMEYSYPPGQGKVPFASITLDEVAALCDCAPHALSKSLLQGVQGISPGMANRLAASCEPGGSAGESVFAELQSMRKALESGTVTPAVYMDDDGTPVDFHVFPIPDFEGTCDKLEFGSVSECVEHFYLNKTGLNRLRQKSADLDRAVRSSLDKMYLKKQRLSEDILAAEKADLYRLYGELLTANLHSISPGGSEARLVNYYDGQEIAIPMDKRLSPSKNAQGYFKRYSKSKTAVKEKSIRLRENDSDIEYLESFGAFIENASSVEEIEALRNELTEEGYLRRRRAQGKQPKAKPAPLAFQTASGFKVMAGRNNRENDELTFKAASRTDVWFHAKGYPGSHVILFTEGQEPAGADVLEAAAIAAYHSKGRQSENVPVDYTQARYVKKPAGAKPGMVIFTNHATVYVNPKPPAGPGATQ